MAGISRRWKHGLVPAIIISISAALNLYRLDRIGMNGTGNFYYAAAVQSMLTSLHNFFYLSVDPAGFVSLDKPPLAFWIQAVCAKLFGFHGASLIIPQALAGIASVYVLYRLVQRAYGEKAAALAALALAVMPISVVTNRNNAPDALLILVLLLAAWALTRAIETDQPGGLWAAAILVGLAFNIKMLQILLVAPALVLLYFVAAPWGWGKRWRYGLGALTLMLLVAACWVVVVELTPPAQRPYVGGSLNNTVTDLILGYNGFERLWGEDFTYFSGAPGTWRLFNDRLGGQAGWLMPLALAGTLAAAWQLRQAPAAQRVGRRNALILWAAWGIPQVVYFSISTFFHRYYLASLAPAIAALAGIGGDALWRAWQGGGYKTRAVVLSTFLACVGVQVYLLLPFVEARAWLIPLLGFLSLAVGGFLLFAGRFPRIGEAHQETALMTGNLALLIAPIVWTLIPVLTCTDSTLPYAGPQVIGNCSTSNFKPYLKPEWVKVFEANREEARYLAATHDMGIAALGILETQGAFMALGGYRGSDPILTVDQFAARVARGEVRYYTAMQAAAEFPVQEEIRQWVKAHCPEVPLADKGILIWGPCEAGE